MWFIVCMYVGISGRNSFKRGRTVKPGKKKNVFFFSFSENEQIGNPCRDGTNKTLDFSLDLR